MAWPLVYDLDSSKFDKRATSQSNQSAIVLVHDAFHAPLHFEGLVRDLRTASVNVLTPQLPSSTSAYQPNIFQVDVQALYDSCRPAMEAGHNLILVLHGYSGLVGVPAAVQLNQYALTRPRAGFVVKIVFVAALVANEGECLLDLVRPEWLIYEVGSSLLILHWGRNTDVFRTAYLEYGGQTKYFSTTVLRRLRGQQPP